MKGKARRITLGSVISWLFGLACALALGAVFYGAMAYQLTGEGAKTAVQSGAKEMPAPLAPGLSSAALYPGPLLALSGAQLIEEKARDEIFGGEACRVITRTYALPSGAQASAISAYPAAYLERMAQQGYVSQLITGFVIADMDAVYALKGEEALLCARNVDYVYMIEATADEQSVYALGMAAYFEE